MKIPDYAKKNFIITEDDTELEILVKQYFLTKDRIDRESQEKEESEKNNNILTTKLAIEELIND